MKVRRPTGCLLALLFLEISIYGAQPTRRTFDAGSFKHPVKLSKSVLNVLAAADDRGFAHDWIEEHPDGDLNQFFDAIPIHLTDSDDQDYLVLGEFPLTGADNDWFWVVHTVNSHPHVILWANGNTLQLSPTTHNGLPDIHTDWWAASGYGWADTFQFNGKKYVRVRHRETVREMK